LGLLVARDGNEALRLMEQFGPPKLLCVNMTAKHVRGISVIESISGRWPEITVAVDASREFREYAVRHRDEFQLRALRPGVSTAVLTTVIERALQTIGTSTEQAANPAGAAQRLQPDYDGLSARVRQELPAPGVAIYVRQPPDGRLSAVVDWSSPAPMSRAHRYLPRVVAHVIRAGTSVMVGDVGTSPDDLGMDGQSSTFAVAAAPVKRGNQIAGVICVFADAPLDAGDDAIARFERIAASAFDDVGETPLQQGPAQLSHEPAAQPPERVENDAEIPDWQPTLLERQRGEFELAREIARARRDQRQMSIVLFDMSERQQQQPAQAGEGVAYEQLLENVVDTFVRAVRLSDLPIRWRGNELLLVLPGVAGSDARAVAERVRAAMQAGGRHRVAVSGGVAEVEPTEPFGAVMRRARHSVSEALERGHNRVM
jgi:diguanylate cyclase (GGDEF)-like protein